MKYGYRMFDCSIAEINDYNVRCYQCKKEPSPADEFPYKSFDSVRQAQSLIGHFFIPSDAELLGNETWSLQGNMLLKEVTFRSPADAVEYQTAIERAWALGAHLDPRVEQSYYE